MAPKFSFLNLTWNLNNANDVKFLILTMYSWIENKWPYKLNLINCEEKAHSFLNQLKPCKSSIFFLVAKQKMLNWGFIRSKERNLNPFSEKNKPGPSTNRLLNS